MIVEHTPEGRITHIVFDPVHPDVLTHVKGEGRTFLDLAPIKLPDEPLLDENGNQQMERHVEPLFDEDGSPLLNDAGEALYQVTMTPVFLTNRIKPVEVSLFDDYVVGGEIAKRPSIALPDLVELTVGQAKTIADLPRPCAIRVDGEAMTIEDGALTLEGDMPAEYEIAFDQWPYKPATVKVIISEA